MIGLIRKQNFYFFILQFITNVTASNKFMYNFCFCFKDTAKAYQCQTFYNHSQII